MAIIKPQNNRNGAVRMHGAVPFYYRKVINLWNRVICTSLKTHLLMHDHAIAHN